MRNIFASILGLLLPLSIILLIANYSAFGFNINEEVDANPKKERESTVNHSLFKELNQDFASGNEVTKVCLTCHNKRHTEILKSSHWKWERKEEIEGKGIVALGKKNVLNNFCIGISGSEESCTRCHIGYGWSDQSFNFNDPSNIDCLVCHDNSGTYKKKKGGAGRVDESVSLSYVAKNVGRPGNENCGVCHFWGGGGNNVKHGDLDKAMLECSKEIDVHMATDGGNMVCIDCHITKNHKMQGKLYALSSENENRMECETCHTTKPHNDNTLDDHILRIACQTCHIPIYAKANSTKMYWDWSSAGELDDKGLAKHENDEDGNHKYMSIKGTFVWDDHVVPEYYWFNGIANHQLITDKIDTIPVQMNSLDGCYKDKGEYQKSANPSKIWPVKVHRGNQIYDPVNMTLIQPKLYGKEKGSGAYWTDFDWGTASQLGMDYLGLPYSGEYAFVETEMYWPLNHQVSPKEESLSCKDCHIRKDGRLQDLNDFYLPGRDFNNYVEFGGWGFIILAFIGCVIHAICRIISRRNCKFNQ